jgi:uncharacterized damage-inducible protein DinB
MPNEEHTRLAPGTEYRSREVALHLAELDDLTRRLFEDLANATPEELAWQVAPGNNTIGMLLAHLAIVEVFWIQIGVLAREIDTAEVIGIAMNDDGMPAPPDGRPPAGLAGRDLAWFRALLERSRAYVKGVAKGLDDAALTVARVRTRRNGTVQHFDAQWVLYHVVEHFAGHYGQILLLRHLHQDARRAAAEPAVKAAP